MCFEQIRTPARMRCMSAGLRGTLSFLPLKNRTSTGQPEFPPSCIVLCSRVSFAHSGTEFVIAVYTVHIRLHEYTRSPRLLESEFAIRIFKLEFQKQFSPIFLSPTPSPPGIIPGSSIPRVFVLEQKKTAVSPHTHLTSPHRHHPPATLREAFLLDDSLGVILPLITAALRVVFQRGPFQR